MANRLARSPHPPHPLPVKSRTPGVKPIPLPRGKMWRVSPNRQATAILTFPTETNRADVAATVRGCKGLHLKENDFTWVVEDGAAANYRQLAKSLAVCGDLYRHAGSRATDSTVAGTRSIEGHLLPCITRVRQPPVSYLVSKSERPELRFLSPEPGFHDETHPHTSLSLRQAEPRPNPTPG